MDSQDNEDRWLLCINPDDKGLYYYNPSTGKLSWDFPGTEFVFTPVLNMAGDSPETNVRISNPGFAVETKHEFHSNDDESLLAIKPKEMLYVYKVSDGWAYGQNVEGKIGYFPMSFVKPIQPPTGYDDLTERPYPLDFTPAMTPSHGKNSSSDSFNLDQSGYDFSYVDSGYNTPVMKGQSNMTNTPISLFSALCSHLYSDLSTDIDIEEYDILKYSQTYFNRKSNKPRELTYNHKPISQSITPLSIDKERKAIEMNKNILLYMGDIKRNGIMNYYELRKVIVISAIRDDIVDELYCQIICQLLNNPSIDSINRGWELFVTIASMKPPSDLLMNYILSFLIKLYKIVGNIGSYAMYCIKLLLNYEKCDDVTMDKLDDILQIQMSSDGIFKCSIDEVLLLESNTQLLFQYNLLPYKDGRYGSNYEISPGYKYSTPFLSPDSIYKLLTNGGFLLVVYGSKSGKGLRTKERRVYVTPQLDCITFYNPVKGTGSSQTIPLSTFCGVSYSKDDLLTHTSYNINNNNNNSNSLNNNNNYGSNGGSGGIYDFNINNNNNSGNNNQYYRRRGSTHGASSEFEDKTFVLIGIEKDKSVQIVTDSLQERNRWILAFRCYFEWYNAIGRCISNDLTVNDLKISFINYLRKILKDPNDFYRCLISGVPCTVTLFNSNNAADENYKHNGLLEITSDLQTVNLKTAQQSIDLQIQYNEIKDVVLGLPDIKTTTTTTTTTTDKDNGDNTTINTASSTPLNMSSSNLNTSLNTTTLNTSTTINTTNTSTSLTSTITSNTSLNKKKYKNNSFYIITKDESKSWCVTLSDQYTMNHYVYMLLSYLYWVKYRGDGIKDKSSNQISFENFIKEPLPQKPLSGTVPKFVLFLINRLKSMNVWSYQGIFRQSANNKSVDETCIIFNQGFYEQLDIIDNAYVVSVCLKKWLRDMSKPLIPDAFYEQVLKIPTTDAPNGALSLVMSLPLYNKESLLYIMKFIKDLIRFSDMTGMKEEGMAIVFAPNICKISMRSKNTDLGEIKNFLVKLLGEIDYPPPEERLGNVPESTS